MSGLGDTSAYGFLPPMTASHKSQQLCWRRQGLRGGASISRTAEEEAGCSLLLLAPGAQLSNQPRVT